MGVPIEFFTLFSIEQVIDKKYLGGLSQFIEDVPNFTYKEDEHLCKVSFMSAGEMDAYMTMVVSKGLEFDEAKPEEGDFVVATNLFGFHWHVPWCYQSMEDDLVYLAI